MFSYTRGNLASVERALAKANEHLQAARVSPVHMLGSYIARALADVEVAQEDLARAIRLEEFAEDNQR